MRLLLDTHIWLWVESRSDRLPTHLVSALVAPENELWLSPVSAWELWLLTQRRRVLLEMDFAAWLTACLSGGRYREAPLTIGVTQAAQEVRLSHRDPSDWLLAATALHYDLLLVTVDERLRTGRGFPIFPA